MLLILKPPGVNRLASLDMPGSRENHRELTLVKPHLDRM